VNTIHNAPSSERVSLTASALKMPTQDWSPQASPAVRPSSSGSESVRRALTDREKQILRLVCDGLSNAEIAAQLAISPETVKSELKRIFRKIGVRNRTQAAGVLVREGWL
jgi:DNA-binding NarL/FixJ family response regulator